MGGAGDIDPSAAVLDRLLAQLESGSAVAAARLRALAVSARGTPTLERVAVAASGGSPYALELLLGLVAELDLAGPAVGRVVGRSSAVRDDVDQEVLVAVARSIHRFRGESRFTTWLYALAHNVAVSHVRRLRPTVELDGDSAAPGGGRRLSSQVAERRTVLAAIESLPPRLRRVVERRDLEGLSYAEIAEREGLEINTVRSRLFRARALLAQRLP